jgi:hypothetical protein
MRMHLWLTVEQCAYAIAAQENWGWFWRTRGRDWAVVAPGDAPRRESEEDIVVLAGNGPLPDGDYGFSCLAATGGIHWPQVDPVMLSTPCPGSRHEEIIVIAEGLPMQPVGSPRVVRPNTPGVAFFPVAAHARAMVTDDYGWALWAIMQGVPTLVLSRAGWAERVTRLAGLPGCAIDTALVWDVLPGMLESAKATRKRMARIIPKLRKETVKTFEGVGKRSTTPD